MPTPVYSAQDGPRVTVDTLIKDPLQVPALILDMTQNEFVVDAVLRNAGLAQSGVVRYEESTPLYADENPEVRAEFAEVPVVPTSIGAPRAVYSHERAMAIMVSDEMRRRQIIDPVTRQLLQVKNTMVYSWNAVFMNAILNNPQVQTLAASAPWDSANATIRADLANAGFLIENANITSPSGVEQWFGFEPDTLIVNHYTKATLLQSQSFAAPYLGDIASENLLYTGKLPNKIFNYDVLVSRQVPAGTAILMQRQRCGFLADELPMMASPLYRDEPRKTWRSDVQRAAAIGFDQPLAICVLTNLGTDTEPPFTG
jgi:hypothetical protein